MSPNEQTSSVVDRVALPAAVLAVVGVLTLAVMHSPTVFALYHDSDQSSGNALQAGSFDGKLTESGPATENGTTDESDADRVRDTWEDYSHANGSMEPVNNTIGIDNPHTSHAVQKVVISLSYTENDSALLANNNAQATAESLNISALNFNGTSYTANVTDANGDGVKDVDDLAQSNVTLGGIAANSSATLELSIAGDSTNNDNLGGNDGIDFTLHVRSVVAPSWEDTDESTNNTVQYKS